MKTTEEDLAEADKNLDELEKEEVDPIEDETENDTKKDLYKLNIDALLDQEISKGEPSKPEKVIKAQNLGFEVPENNQMGQPIQRTI